MLIALFIIQGLVDLYLLRAVYAQYRRHTYLRESVQLLVRAADLTAELVKRINVKQEETVQ